MCVCVYVRVSTSIAISLAAQLSSPSAVSLAHWAKGRPKATATATGSLRYALVSSLPMSNSHESLVKTYSIFHILHLYAFTMYIHMHTHTHIYIYIYILCYIYIYIWYGGISQILGTTLMDDDFELWTPGDGEIQRATPPWCHPGTPLQPAGNDPRSLGSCGS